MYFFKYISGETEEIQKNILKADPKFNLATSLHIFIFLYVHKINKLTVVLNITTV